MKIVDSWREYSANLLPLLIFSPPTLQKNAPEASISAKALEELKLLKLDVAKVQLRIKLTKTQEYSQAGSEKDQQLVVSVKRVRKPCHQDAELSIRALDADYFELGIADPQNVLQLLKIQRICVVLNHQKSQSTPGTARYFLFSKHLEFDGVDLHIPHELDEVLTSMRLLLTGLFVMSESTPSAKELNSMPQKHASNPGIFCTPIPEVSLRFEQSSSPMLPRCFEHSAEDQSEGGDSCSQPAEWRVFSAHKTRDSLFRDKLTVLVKNLKLTLSDHPLEVSP